MMAALEAAELRRLAAKSFLELTRKLFPWCLECDMECTSVDEDGCCVSCGVDLLYDENGDPNHNAAWMALREVRALMLSKLDGEEAVPSPAFQHWLEQRADPRPADEPKG